MSSAARIPNIRKWNIFKVLKKFGKKTKLRNAVINVGLDLIYLLGNITVGLVGKYFVKVVVVTL